MPNEHVLIVDDNPTNLKLLRIILEEEGYDVATANDAEEALRRLADAKPSMILMDIQLPGLDGLELTRRLKADPEYRAIVIIALTASAMKGDEEKARAAGCDGYITKPIDAEQLPSTLAAYLAKSRPLAGLKG